MNLLTKNNTSGYNTIVDAADAKDVVKDHRGGDTTTIRKKNRRKMFLVIGGSVSAFVVGVLLFCATQASSSLPPSTPSLSSLRATTLGDPPRQDDDKGGAGWFPFQCYPNRSTCGGLPFFPIPDWLLPNGGCCDNAKCIPYDFEQICFENPTTAPSLPPTKAPTNSPTSCVVSGDTCHADGECCGAMHCYISRDPTQVSNICKL